MPKLSGMETLREIRKIEGEVSVIIITGYGTQKDEKEALHYGVTDFISKPFYTSNIISVIDRILGGLKIGAEISYLKMSKAIMLIAPGFSQWKYRS